jgi:hypothetical protein
MRVSVVLPGPAQLRDILDASGPRPAPYWPSDPEPPDDAPYPARRAYQQAVRRCWDTRMRLVGHVLRARAQGHWPPQPQPGETTHER